jgi:hypothetical protein
MTKNARWRGAGLAASIAVAVVLVPGSVFAGSKSTFLPNGAPLTVTVNQPVTSTEFNLPPGQPTLNVSVTGSASIGLGERDATFAYVIDVSGSTEHGSGTGCAPILQCEQLFVKALNQAVINDGSADEAGVAVFATQAATADMAPAVGDQIIVAPDAPGTPPLYVDTVVDSTFSVDGGNGGVGQFTNKTVGFETNCTGGLAAALSIVNASTNGTNIVVLVSDGLCDSSGGDIAAFQAAIAALASAGAVVDTIAAGTGSSCDNHEPGFDGTLRAIATGTGGICREVSDPGMLPNIIPQLIGSTLVSLAISVDGGPMQPIPNAQISQPLPRPGATSVTYATNVTVSGPGDHQICVTANGADVTGGTGSVTQCETIHVLQLTAAPAEATNNLGGGGNQHTVNATILGPPSHIGGRTVTFLVGGQNAGATGTCSPNPACTTDAGGQVSFTYTVPVAPTSLGTDTITVSTVIAGTPRSVTLIKHWIDITPPAARCVEGPNPHGQTVPPAGSTTPPGTKGGQNDEGFYRLLAVDPVDPNPDIFVGTTAAPLLFGPFSSGTVVKITEAPGATPNMKSIGSASGQAGAVAAHIILNADAVMTAVDNSGNATTATCLVPPPPK